MEEMYVDFDVLSEKRLTLLKFGEMRGKKIITVRADRSVRTHAQNRYYHGNHVRMFADFLRDQGEAITNNEAHMLLRAKFLRETVVNRATGEPIGQKIRSTTDLDTAEFGEYIDKVAAWLADMFGIVVPDPDVYRVAG